MKTADSRCALPTAPQQSPLGLYVHVPFCASICNYCNFNRGLLDDALKTRYLEALRREIADAGDGTLVDTIYFGGGTPSLLGPADVASLLEACHTAYRVDDGAEVTLEANPESARPDYLRELRAIGVNRLSLGVQSFSDDELARLGRRHDAPVARAAYEGARAAGFDNLSLDLMMWLPEQSLEDWLFSVRSLIELAPDHASLYLLEIYPNAPLREDMARSGWSQAADDLAADMYLEGLALLEAAGYQQYEISNVARDGRFSRHNVKYWTDGAWMGFGPGAHGTRAGVRWRNVSGSADYVARVTGGGDPRADARALSAEDALAEAMFMGLRLVGGVDIAAMDARYESAILDRYGRDFDRFIEGDVLAIEEGRLRLTRRGMLLANEILTVFV